MSKFDSIPVLDAGTAASLWDPPPAPTEDDPAPDLGSPVWELTAAQRARIIVDNGRKAVISLISPSKSGPYALIVRYSTDPLGIPLIAFRNEFRRKMDIKTDMPMSLTIMETTSGADPAIALGVTLSGNLSKIKKAELQPALESYSKAQSTNGEVVRREMATLYGVSLRSVVIFHAEGILEQVDLSDYAAGTTGQADEDNDSGLVVQLSQDRDGLLVLLCRAYGGLANVTSAQLVAVDQGGLEMLAITPDGPESVRVKFIRPVSSSEEVKREIENMVRGARFKLGMK